MLFQIVLALVVVLPFSRFAMDDGGAQSNVAGEYSKHFGALGKLSIAVAEAMPPDQYGFRPHPESMNFGELIAHIATTNYQFCAGLKDSEPPSLPSPIAKDAAAHGFHVLPKRWVVERTLAWICRNRRLAKDYEHLPAVSEAFVKLAMIRLMVARLA